MKHEFIFCPINGAMGFDEHERSLLETETLRRLLYVKQLEFIYLVYPGCQHTRYEHTLGVTHLLKNVCENTSLMDDYLIPTLWDKVAVEEYELFERDCPDDFKKKFIERVLSLCGIMHDIGHGPFSHFSEVVLAATGLKQNPLIRKEGDREEKNKLFDDGVKLHEWVMCETLLYHDKETEANAKKLMRDRYANSFIDKKLDCDTAKLFKIEADKWGDLLKRRYEVLHGPLERVAIEELKIQPAKFRDFRKLIAYGACGKVEPIRQLIYGVFDLDRLDYIRRDSYMAGVKYGSIEIDRMLKSSFTFDKDIRGAREDLGTDTEEGILVDYAKGIAALEHMYVGKNLLYFTTIYHPCSSVARNMLLRYILETSDFKATKNSDRTQNWPETVKYMTKILDMEDNDFIEYLRDISKGESADDMGAGTKNYISRVLDRNLYKKIAVLQWTELHPSIRETVKKADYKKLLAVTESYEDLLGAHIFKAMPSSLKGTSSNMRDFEEKEGKVVFISLPVYNEKPSDIEKAVVRRKNLYGTHSDHRASEISPVLEVSQKMEMRNHILSVHLYPAFASKLKKNKNLRQDILDYVTKLFSVHNKY